MKCTTRMEMLSNGVSMRMNCWAQMQVLRIICLLIAETIR